MADESIAALGTALTGGECSSVELTRHFLSRIEAADGVLNSFVSVTAEQALEQAAEADARIARGEAGPLTGIPIAHKDIFCTAGVRTTCGSRMLAEFVSPYDATVVQRLREAGTVMLGKTNMDEFAMGSSNETSWFGPVRNPWDTGRVPGGSSGGSAAAVAAGLAVAATGTDTGGSIRQPASFCGLTGLKPTYGRVSRYGMVAFASSLDQAGPMTRSVADAALLLCVMAGADPRDSTCLAAPAPDFSAALNGGVAGLTIGLPKEYFSSDLDPDTAATVETALKELERQGAKLKEISLATTPLAIATYYVVAPAECSSNLSRFDGVRYGYRIADAKDLDDLYTRSRSEGFGAEVKRRIMMGTYVLSAGYYDAYYLRAQRVRRLIKDDFTNAFREVDLVAGPATPGPAFGLGDKADDPISMYLSDVYTSAASLAGLPAMSLPAGLVAGLPVGLQLIGNYLDEARLLAAGHALQQATDWHRQRPTANPGSK
ncbi:MAG: Asp-tRNA(Asn)/Glu-tRNA(Gln) amidotransferase subunit GatA [Pseudomonadota bacterium]|nr:Asp-tRNA(Asn)/Glu-tRNA(Gln) amidotransferase subunit GatA [Pseudomonadota bacterium]